MRNLQNGQQPAFGEPEPFKVDDEPILARYGNPAPLVADWDGDGRLDVLMGSSDGSVVWYRNAGAADDTVLEEERLLVPERIHGDDDSEDGTIPGRDALPCVCDFNADGRLDLLVGGLWMSLLLPDAELTDDEREHDAALEQKLDVLSKKFSGLRDALDKESTAAKGNRLVELQLVGKKIRALRRELNRLPPDLVVTRHGQIWIYFGQKAQQEK